MANLSLTTMTNGHMMFQEVYNSRLSHFVDCLKQANLEVIHACKPVSNYDYSFFINSPSTTDPKKLIPTEVMTKFAVAGLKTKVEAMGDSNSFIIRCTER